MRIPLARMRCRACGTAAILSPHWFDSDLRSLWTFHLEERGEERFVLVVDLDGDLSVTNDAERVVQVLATVVPLYGRRVLYRDTDGRWDELVLAGGLRRDVVGRGAVFDDDVRFARFGPVGARGTCADAIAAAAAPHQHQGGAP